VPKKPLCIIPARGGSKRFPRKNIAHLAGKPLVAHTVETARECDLFDRVCVSSDDDEILQVAASYGAVPLRRSDQFAQDRTPLVDVARDVIENFSDQGQSYAAFALLLATCPLRTVKDLKTSYEVFQTQDANYVVSVSAYANPPQRAVWAPNTYMEPYFGLKYMKQTQLLDTLYYCNGAFSWLKTEVFLRENQWTYGSKTIPYFTPPERSVDIDNPMDLAFAEFLMSYPQKNNEGNACQPH